MISSIQNHQFANFSRNVVKTKGAVADVLDRNTAGYNFEIDGLRLVDSEALHQSS